VPSAQAGKTETGEGCWVASQRLRDNLSFDDNRRTSISVSFDGRKGMAYQIIANLCSACGACEAECPVAAIRPKGAVFVIDPDKCVECQGHYDSPQCAAVCPTEACVPLRQG
jgi:ferredoxin